MTDDNAEPTAGSTRSTRRLLGQLRDNLTALVAYEIAQAKRDVITGVKQQLSGVILVGAAAVLLLVAVVFAGVAAAVALTQLMPEWASWLSVAGIAGLVAAALIATGKKRLATPPRVSTVMDDTKQAFTTLARRVTTHETDV